MLYRLTPFLLAASLLCGAAPIASAQPVTNLTPLALSYDLDGEAADNDQVVASVQLADAGNYTIAAQPDTCRLIDITITDADSSISAGTLTVVGTDCYGAALTSTFTFAAGGSGVKTLTVTSGKASAAYYASITSVTNGTLTGEAAGDLLIVGYTSNSVYGYPMYGRLETSPSGRRRIDIFGFYAGNVAVKNGAATTDIVPVTASTNPFQNVAVGDLLLFNVRGEIFFRKVATRASANAITVNTGVTLPTTGLKFEYKKFYFSTDPQDGWIPVTAADVFTSLYQVDANVATGGATSSVECAEFIIDGPNVVPDVTFEEDTQNIASGAAGSDTTSIDLRLKPHYTHCRVGVKFGTGDDGDGANENIDIVVGLKR